MKKHQIFCLTVLFATTAGCAFNSTRTPGGTHRTGMIGAGLVSWDNVDTETKSEECREILKGGNRIDQQAMLDRDVYQSCYAQFMMPVEPMGQPAMPIPVDFNGDGTPDAMRWPEGYQVPMGLYQQYPGYWPGVMQAYGIQPMAYGGVGMYNGQMYEFPGAISTVDGSSLDPRMQPRPVAVTTTQAPSQSADYATKQELQKLQGQMKATVGEVVAHGNAIQQLEAKK